MAVLVFEIQVSDFLGPLFRPPLDEVVEDVGDDWTLHPAMDVMPRLPGTLKQSDQISLPSLPVLLFQLHRRPFTVVCTSRVEYTQFLLIGTL